MDNTTGSTGGPNCDKCLGKPKPPPPPPPKRGDNRETCGGGCHSGSDCWSGLFCCPSRKMCMGRDTRTTGGPGCKRARDSKYAKLNNVDYVPGADEWKFTGVCTKQGPWKNKAIERSKAISVKEC